MPVAWNDSRIRSIARLTYSTLSAIACIAILARHPAGDDILAASAIEAIQTLNGRDRPLFHAGDRFQPGKLIAGGLRVTVEADEQMRARARPHQHTAVNSCCRRASAVEEKASDADRNGLAWRRRPIGADVSHGLTIYRVTI